MKEGAADKMFEGKLSASRRTEGTGLTSELDEGSESNIAGGNEQRSSQFLASEIGLNLGKAAHKRCSKMSWVG